MHSQIYIVNTALFLCADMDKQYSRYVNIRQERQVLSQWRLVRAAIVTAHHKVLTAAKA